jgi:HPr kinase/phosphorylase
LALRFLHLPASALSGTPALVADDQVALRRRAGRVEASCPAPLLGRIEARGLGIARVTAVEKEARLALLADLDAAACANRFPEALEWEEVLGVAIRRIALDPFEASAPVKLALALQNMLEDPGIN